MIDNTETFKHSPDNADYLLKHAVRSIDEQFGSGYAAKNPVLVGHFMQTAVLDYQTEMISSALRDIANK